MHPIHHNGRKINTPEIEINLLQAVMIYGLLWISFGVGHSILAREPIQERLKPVFGRTYRLSYNVLALVHIGVVFFIGRMILERQEFEWLTSGFSGWLLRLASVCGIILILLALRQYDTGLFSGLKQLRSGEEAVDADTVEPLNTTGFNAWVRHPLYTGAFLFLWGNATTEFGFFTAVFGSVYLIIGAHYEEKKLLSLYGDDYRVYRTRVPAFVPWRLGKNS